METESFGLLRDPVTGKSLVILGQKGHEITVKHRPRVPVLDVPGRQGDEVQFLGRKSRIYRLRRGIADGLATSELHINPVLVNGITIRPGVNVELGAQVEEDMVVDVGVDLLVEP